MFANLKSQFAISSSQMEGGGDFYGIGRGYDACRKGEPDEYDKQKAWNCQDTWRRKQ